ncbi:MAG: hypothetical protein GTN59_01960 [Candidatus Dadabacteria bacterium]|nr:hypothetical protein [Candidatus Dadabacteria bacterium]
MNQIIQEWGNALSKSLEDVGGKIIRFIPNLLAAIIILVFGWLIAVWLGKLVDKVVKIIGLNTLCRKFKVEEVLKRTGWKNDVASFLGVLVKWIILIVVFITTADALKLYPVTEFLNRVLSYSPSVIAAVGILLVGVLLGNFLGNIVKGAVKAAEIKYADILGAVTKYVILVFSVLAALIQLGIATSLIQILVQGVVGSIAIAAGLAFGLGGKDAASEILEKVKKDLSRK